MLLRTFGPWPQDIRSLHLSQVHVMSSDVVGSQVDRAHGATLPFLKSTWRK